jgi:RNA polymerase sigma factor (sigma-70 family)
LRDAIRQRFFSLAGHLRGGAAVSFPELDSDSLVRLQAGLRLLARFRLADSEAAEEAAQEAFGRVLVAIREGRLNDPARLGGFARATLLHVIADVFRAWARYEPLDPAVSDSGSSPDDLSRLITQEELQRLRAAVAELSSADRTLIRLAFAEQLSGPQLAERLGEPADRIRKRKQRAMERLRAALLGPGGHDPPSSPTIRSPTASQPAVAEDTG